MKLVPPEGYEYSDGRKAPGGTFIGQNTWAAMRDKSVFGDDAEMFRPDRFLEVDATTRGKMRSTVDLVFGSGVGSAWGG
jgi:cytochrome P450